MVNVKETGVLLFYKIRGSMKTKTLDEKWFDRSSFLVYGVGVVFDDEM